LKSRGPPSAFPLYFKEIVLGLCLDVAHRPLMNVVIVVPLLYIPKKEEWERRDEC